MAGLHKKAEAGKTYRLRVPPTPVQGASTGTTVGVHDDNQAAWAGSRLVNLSYPTTAHHLGGQPARQYLAALRIALQVSE